MITKITFKHFLTHLSVGFVSLLIGVLAANTITNQWELLGTGIFSFENIQHNDYMKRGPNILKFLLFLGASIGGVGYGITEMYRALISLSKTDAGNE